MHRGGKRSEVTPRLRKEWLRRNEEGGESPTEIAAAIWDVRTVRKHLGLARQDREVTEANVGVFRQAIQDHYKDICSFCERLDSRLAEGFNPISLSERDVRIRRALQQHLPRSRIWRGLDKWEELVVLLEPSLVKLREVVTDKVEGKMLQELANSGAEFDQIGGIVEALISHLYALAMGLRGLQDTPYIHTPTNNDEEIEVRHDRFRWIMPSQLVNRIEETLDDMKVKGLQWQEYRNLHILSQNLLEVKRDLREELATVGLRRVIPGHCIYCPMH